MIPYLLGLALAGGLLSDPHVLQGRPATLGEKAQDGSWSLEVSSSELRSGRVDFGAVSSIVGPPQVGQRVSSERGQFLVVEVSAVATLQRTPTGVQSPRGVREGRRTNRRPTSPSLPSHPLSPVDPGRAAQSLVDARRARPRGEGGGRRILSNTPTASSTALGLPATAQLTLSTSAGVGGSRVFVSLDVDFSGDILELGPSPTVLDVPVVDGRPIVHHLGLWLPEDGVGQQLHDVRYTLSFL